MSYKGRIGYACTPLSIPYSTSNSFMLRNFNEENFKICTRKNLINLRNILQWNIDNGIYLFRISSDIIPFESHIVNRIEWWGMFEDELAEIGAFIRDHQIRVSMHPGQYTVLNSPQEEVVQRALADLEYHCRFLDSLGVDYTNKIVLHVGGVYGDKETALQRFIQNYKRLSSSAKKRLIVENDDKSYTIEDVLRICDCLQIPAVFDNLHHKINSCHLEWAQILQHVAGTWRREDGRIKFHYSDQDSVKKGGAHSKSVVTSNFLDYIARIKEIDADIMLEVKDKELSALKCISALEENLPISKRITFLDKYKYSIMEKSLSGYKKCNSLIQSETPMASVIIYMDSCLNSPFDQRNFIHTAKQIYSHVKDRATDKEKELFYNLLQNPEENILKIKGHLRKLCKKYYVNPVNQSYYFIL